MLKIINALLCFFTLALALDTRADDNLVLSRYTSPSSIPAHFLALGGGSSMTGKSYKDDSGKSRSDKVYYTTTHTYLSSYRMADIQKMLNPAEGRLDNLFEDTTVNKSSRPGLFDVMMVISTPIKDFDVASTLSYKNMKIGKKNIFVYDFSNFNMVFTDMVIQVEVEEVGSSVKVRLFQIAAIKGSTYDKLKSFFAVGKFEKAMKSNIKNFKAGIGGI